MTDLDALIDTAAAAHGLPANLVRAICETESARNPWAVRYEPSYRWLVGVNRSPTETVMQQCSWGLMQVMGGVAREYGLTGWLSQLCDPAIGLAYGCRHLKRYYDRHQNWRDAIASYNAGRPITTPDGSYINESYVQKVYQSWMRLDRATI